MKYCINCNTQKESLEDEFFLCSAKCKKEYSKNMKEIRRVEKILLKDLRKNSK